VVTNDYSKVLFPSCYTPARSPSWCHESLCNCKLWMKMARKHRPRARSLCLWLKQQQWLVRQRVILVRSRLLLALKVIAVIANQKSGEKSSIFDRKNIRTTWCNPYRSMPSPWLDTTDFRLIVGSTSSEKHSYSLCISVFVCFQVFFVETMTE